MNSEWRITNSELRRLGGFVIGFALALLAGCAQDNDQRQVQPSVQPQTTSTKQEAAAQAPIYITLMNGNPRGGGVAGAVPIGVNENGIADLINEAANSSSNGNGSGGQRATHAMSATTINVTTGGQTQTPTGTATGGAMALTPSQAATQAPVQHIQPEFTTAIPIAVGPNSSQQATATGRGTTSDVAKQDQLQQAYTDIRAQNDFIRSLLAELAKRPTGGVPSSQPASPQTEARIKPAGEIVNPTGP